MLRAARGLLHLAASLCFVLIGCESVLASDLDQHLRQRYQGKTLVIRGFFSADHLYYDTAGAVIGGPTAGDWTADGFVQVNDIRTKHRNLVIRAKRQFVVSVEGTFQLRVADDRKPGKEKKSVSVEIQADLGKEGPSPEDIDAVIARIFLTSQDHLGRSVPDYWQPCIYRGLRGVDKNCKFSADLLAVPGVSPADSINPTLGTPPLGSLRPATSPIFHVGGGVSPPRAIYSPNPEFTERARGAKYQGTTTLGLIVNEDGNPTNIRILGPIGCGLDAQAVHAVETWKFTPAEKEGKPVRVEIAVEVDFHLY